MFGKPLKDTLLKRIENGITAAILFVNQNYKLQYLFYPQVHYNDDGEPVSIVGNASNSGEQMMLVEIDLTKSLQYFVCIFGSDREPAGLAGPNKLPKAMLADTAWNDREEDTMVACLASKVVPIPFGTDPPYGPIMDEKVATAFEKMGTGYERYLDMIRTYKESSLADIKKIVTVVKAEDGGEQKYFHVECEQRVVDNAEGPFLVETLLTRQIIQISLITSRNSLAQAMQVPPPMPTTRLPQPSTSSRALMRLTRSLPRMMA